MNDKIWSWTGWFRYPGDWSFKTLFLPGKTIFLLQISFFELNFTENKKTTWGEWRRQRQDRTSVPAFPTQQITKSLWRACHRWYWNTIFCEALKNQENRHCPLYLHTLPLYPLRQITRLSIISAPFLPCSIETNKMAAAVTNSHLRLRVHVVADSIGLVHSHCRQRLRHGQRKRCRVPSCHFPRRGQAWRPLACMCVCICIGMSMGIGVGAGVPQRFLRRPIVLLLVARHSPPMYEINGTPRGTEN